ncbi:MAG: hypothetical protein QM769_11160 [Pseudoxanthomonas sp.]
MQNAYTRLGKELATALMTQPALRASICKRAGAPGINTRGPCASSNAKWRRRRDG